MKLTLAIIGNHLLKFWPSKKNQQVEQNREDDENGEKIKVK